MAKGDQFKIEQALLSGESRESLNLKYNPRTVSRVINKLNKDKQLNNFIEDKGNGDDKSTKIEKLINELFDLLVLDNPYEVKVNIKKKTMDPKNIVNEVIDEKIINPFEIYNEENKSEMIDKLKEKSQEYLLKIIRKYFKYNGNKMKILTTQELAEHICNEVEKVVDLGKCFR